MKSILSMLILGFLPLFAWGETDSLCGVSERVYFSCSTGRKLVSVCGSTHLDDANAYLQYRFGQTDKVELEYPSARKGSLEAFKFYHYVRPLVSRVGLSFQSGNYTYTVYDHYEGDMEPEETSVGVSVSRNDDSDPTEISCKGKATNRLIELEEFVPCDPENALSDCPG